MRRDIEHSGWNKLSYEIREIVAVAKKLQDMGLKITWENIGDPIQKGEKVPDWIKDIVSRLVTRDITYGYTATEGLYETRKFLAEQVNKRNGYRISEDDILFFNGLGDAVAKIFFYLKREARIIGPSPAYSTHSSAEAAHSGYDHLTYNLDPAFGWMPDLDDLEKKIKYNDSIAGMLIINPDNPTGAVYPKPLLLKMMDIARRYKIFVICDEIYAHIVYNGAETVHLSEVIGELPGISLRGISKEFPWPGARCGWIEVFNQDRYPVFKRYIKSLLNSKMLEVCSTSLPQYAIPEVIGDPRYKEHLRERNRMFEKRVNEAHDIFSRLDRVYVSRPQGAFYMTVLFDEGALNDSQTLSISAPAVQSYIDELTAGVKPDKRFVYYLMASTGICVVPLSGFCCERQGFRITLLEMNDEKRLWTWNTIADCIKKYLAG